MRKLLIPIVVFMVAFGVGFMAVPGQADPWVFEETFEGSPNAPAPWAPDNWTILPDLGDGLTCTNDSCTTFTHVPVMAGHGQNCSPPPDMHTVGGQHQGFYLCNDHMMSTVHSGYGTASFTPAQTFNFDGRTGTIEFEVNCYSFGREWWALYLVPPTDDREEFQLFDEGGDGPEPMNGVQFSYIAKSFKVRVWRNGVKVQEFTDTWTADSRNTDGLSSESDCMNPQVRYVNRIQISRTSWEWVVESKDNPGQEYVADPWSGRQFNSPLTFSTVNLHFEHYSYNPTKDGIDPQFFTFHWDNVRFDGTGGTSSTPTPTSILPTATTTPSATLAAPSPTTTSTVVPPTASPSATPTPTVQPPTNTPNPTLKNCRAQERIGNRWVTVRTYQAVVC